MRIEPIYLGSGGAGGTLSTLSYQLLYHDCRCGEAVPKIHLGEELVHCRNCGRSYAFKIKNP